MSIQYKSLVKRWNPLLLSACLDPINSTLLGVHTFIPIEALLHNVELFHWTWFIFTRLCISIYPIYPPPPVHMPYFLYSSYLYAFFHTTVPYTTITLPVNFRNTKRPKPARSMQTRYPLCMKFNCRIRILFTCMKSYFNFIL